MDSIGQAGAAGALDPRLSPVDFAAICGWEEDDHAAAFRAFLAGAPLIAEKPPRTRGLGIAGHLLQAAAQVALAAPGSIGALEARRFFESRFRPYRIAASGFVTGYYEPELTASLTRTERFPIPLYRRPDDLVDVPDDHRPAGWDPEIRFARRTSFGLEPYFDRPAIEAGALSGRGLELAWLPSAVDAFFVHIQGSARLRLTDGTTLRVAFDGKSGHAYTSIGRLAVERGLLPLDGAHKEGLERWLREHPAEGVALMQENRSFIFFRPTELGEGDGPMGAAGVPLTAGRSLAVDRTLMTFHAPVWVDAPELADPDRGAFGFRRLMIAQDTGSAIVGPARGDLFFGSGDTAGTLAGGVSHRAEMTVLIPTHPG